jgi:hypothetical protein
MRMVTTLALAVFVGGVWDAPSASAQPLGTFRWQLQPYCNVITVAVVQQGGQYQLDGTDDQCGAVVKGSVVGLAFQNPDGTIGFGLSIVTTPGGAPVHVDATISIATLGGTWRDSAGNSGTFIFTPGAAVPGAPRPVSSSGLPPGSITNVQIVPGTIGVGQINTAEVQQRLTAGSGITIAGATISFNGQIGAATELVRRGTTGSFGQASGWQPDPTATPGIWLESGSSESGGFFANGNTAGIWSPGDSTFTVLNGATPAAAVAFSIFDEDFLSPGSTASPIFLFGRGARAIDTWTGALLTSGGAWTNSSDRRRKKNILPLDTRDALARLRRLPIYEWNYTAEADGVRHIGPMAQDFHAAFGLNGDDDTHIATVDADGVVMASVVEVAKESEALRAENARLVKELSALAARLKRIERQLSTHR